MGIFDKAKDFMQNNPDKVGQAVDRGGDMVDERTGGKYSEQVDKAQDMLKGQFGGGQPAAEEPAAEAPVEERPVDPAPVDEGGFGEPAPEDGFTEPAPAGEPAPEGGFGEPAPEGEQQF